MSPSTTQYTVRYTHLGYSEYARALSALSDGSWPVVGSLDPNGTLVADLEASNDSGADPDWYDFELTDVPANCSVQKTDPEPWTLLLRDPSWRHPPHRVYRHMRTMSVTRVGATKPNEVSPRPGSS